MNHINLAGVSVTPSKIICIGRNYVDHIKELNSETPDDMAVFIKPNSAITEVLNAVHIEPLHFEAELCFLIKDGKYSAVAIGLDLTKRALQSKLKKQGLPWERSKAFDGSAVFSDFVAFDGVVDDLNFSLDIEGKNIQTGNVELMIYKPDVILSELKKFLTLEDGDIVMTGTPAGVGMVKAGQKFEARLFNADKLLSAYISQAV
ncbi:MAG: fumarylacetoacetate hydrolase family protein [Alphaproteobacteria bacterium]|nr:fumarylacetoacetate hydrolase family protein [Alphaproteobacteria bacterium]